MVDQDTAKDLLAQPETKLRMAPETYVKFDGTNHVILQNAYCDEALRIQSDILLILFEMAEWKAIGEVTAPWPEGDQQKILNYMEMFNRAQLIEFEGMEQLKKDKAGDDAHAKEKLSHNKVPINVENHHNMLKDNVRLSAYRRAIEQTVKPGDVVMDLGAGTGVLGFFAAKAGAGKVYAIERRPHIVELGQAIADANGLKNVQFVENVSTQLQPEALAPQPSVMVSEIIGDGILEENILEYTIDARDRLLKPNSTLIPCKLEIYGFPFFSDYFNQYKLEVNEFNDLYGIDFSLVGDVLASKATLRRERYHPQIHRTMGKPKLLQTLDLTTLTKTHFTEACELTLERDGMYTGVCLYFKAWLTETTSLTNSPWAPQTHWTQLLYSLAEPRHCHSDDTLAFDLIYDGALRITLND